jgi:hypothetical protein
MEIEKRKYTKLSPVTWAEVRALWETGEPTLEELTSRYGVTTRALQSHFEKNKSIKGSKAREIAAAVQKEVFADCLFDEKTRGQTNREARLADFDHARTIENLIMAQLESATDPASAFKTSAAIKTLSLAAQALERTSAMKHKAIGPVIDEETLPVIRFEDLTLEDIREHHRSIGSSDYEDDPEGDAVGEEKHDGSARAEPANDDQVQNDNDIVVIED